MISLEGRKYFSTVEILRKRYKEEGQLKGGTALGSFQHFLLPRTLVYLSPNTLQKFQTEIRGSVDFIGLEASHYGNRVLTKSGDIM